MHHAETSQSTHNATNLIGCNKMQAQNQNKPEYREYLQFHNIN